MPPSSSRRRTWLCRITASGGPAIMFGNPRTGAAHIYWVTVLEIDNPMKDRIRNNQSERQIGLVTQTC
jgi:hypothetical protein